MSGVFSDKLRKEEILDNFRRAAIFGFIIYNPDCRQCDLKNGLEIHNQCTINHHLRVLESNGLIISYRGSDGHPHYAEKRQHERSLRTGQRKQFMSPPAYADRQGAGMAAA